MPPVRSDLATRARYSQGAGIFRIVPAAVGRPTDRHELERVLHWAAERDLAVTPRGAGSAMDGGNVGDGLVLDLTALVGGRPTLDVDRATIRADAGVALSGVAQVAAGAGLRFGPDPSSAAWATVGGVISTNAAGARSHRLGAVDRWVSGLELLTADGPLRLDADQPVPGDHAVIDRLARDAAPLLAANRTAVEAHAPRTRKDTAGYRLVPHLRSGHPLDLVIGSEGTLGVITEATLRLEPIPAHRATVQVAFAERAAMAGLLSAIEPAAPVSVEFFDRSFLRLVADQAADADEARRWRDAAAILLVDLEDHDAASLERRIAMLGAVPGAEIVVARDPVTIAALWSMRHRASPLLAGLDDGRRSLQVIEDGCVPPALLAAYLDAVESACGDAGVDAVMFGHAGDGHVHVNLLPDLRRGDWLEAVRTILARVTDALVDLGGTPAGEHGAGRLRGPLLERFVGSESIACMRAVKLAFDPAGRFNPGVILDADGDPLARLKVGPGAAPIPAEIAAELLRIEAERGWAGSRWPAAETRPRG